MADDPAGRFISVRHGFCVVHPIARITHYISGRDGSPLPVFKECETPYPEPVCSCGYYLVEWAHA